MCGIVGAIAQRQVEPILMEGLRRLEYRGYDSAGIALLGSDEGIQRRRTEGKVQRLADNLAEHPIMGVCGVAHTRCFPFRRGIEIRVEPSMRKLVLFDVLRAGPTTPLPVRLREY